MIAQGHFPNAVVYPESQTTKGAASFVALDVEGAPSLLQVGGQPGQYGLSAPSWTAPDSSAWLYPFSSRDWANVDAFAMNIDPAFLPRPQRAQPAIAAGNRHPEVSLPAVFAGFDAIRRRTGVNLASTVQLSATREMTTDDAIAARNGSDPTAPGHTRVSIRHLYHAGVWAAIRSGYRYGYNAEADHFIVTSPESIDRVKEAIHHAAGYTKFTTDTSKVFDLRADVRHPSPYSEAEIEERFEGGFSTELRNWMLGTFSGRFSAADIKRLGVKFGASLLRNEDLYDTIVREKGGAPFDFEPSLDEAATLTTADELFFYMHWLRERGRPAQLVPPNLGFKKRQAYPETRPALLSYIAHKMWPELAQVTDPLGDLKARVRELAEVAREFDGTLSIHSGSGKQPEVLANIGEATGGRWNYKISGELQLQLFDALYEQPKGSPERALYERMVAACERFAAAGAFGEESELAAQYRASGRGSYLGDAKRGRVDGNLFLVFWLGNMVGSRDEDGRYFKQALDELPASIIAEVRGRNQAYVEWLALHLS